MSIEDINFSINQKLKRNFDGRIVRKDLTKKIKEGANVPVYVLEFLLGQYCSSDDEAVIEDGLKTVKRILADNYVRPDEAQKIMSLLRQRGSYTVIDKLTVHLNIKTDTYEAEFSNLGIKDIPISESQSLDSFSRTEIVLNLENSGFAEMELLTAKGERVQKFQMEGVAGKNSIEWNGSKLPRGSYFVRVSQNGKNYFFKGTLR